MFSFSDDIDTGVKFETETATRTVLTLLVPTRDWYLAVPGLYLFLGCWRWCSELYSLPSHALGPRALPLCSWNYLLMISRVKGCKLRDVGFTQAPLQPPLQPLKGKLRGLSSHNAHQLFRHVPPQHCVASRKRAVLTTVPPPSHRCDVVSLLSESVSSKKTAFSPCWCVLSYGLVYH